MLLNAYKFILDIFFPIECAGCGIEGSWLCKKCFNKLQYRQQQYCLHCKKENTFGRFCSDCGKNYALNGAWIACNYHNKIIVQLIKNFKYHFALDISIILGDFVSLFFKDLSIKSKEHSTFKTIKLRHEDKPLKILANLSNALLIPVPLHNKRKKWRGFNQAEKIAEIISNNFNIQINSKQLLRIKHKKPQVQLKEQQRKKNIQNCFKWDGNKLNNQNVILIDDIVTTGATLNECASVLKQAGAQQVWGLVIAKG